MPPIAILDEEFGKVVGRSSASPQDYDRLVAAASALMPRLPFPKGVFRFRTHEEANAWMDHYILQTAIKKRLGYPKGPI
jgi:hypothetical protein